MAERQALTALTAVLANPDSKTLIVALEGIENFLKVGKLHFPDEKGENQFAIMLEYCGGVDRIEALQTHKNHEVYERALRLLETYFSLDSGDADNLMGVID
jgi:importin subunit alpha-1